MQHSFLEAVAPATRQFPVCFHIVENKIRTYSRKEIAETNTVQARARSGHPVMGGPRSFPVLADVCGRSRTVDDGYGSALE